MPRSLYSRSTGNSVHIDIITSIFLLPQNVVVYADPDHNLLGSLQFWATPKNGLVEWTSLLWTANVIPHAASVV